MNFDDGLGHVTYRGVQDTLFQGWEGGTECPSRVAESRLPMRGISLR